MKSGANICYYTNGRGHWLKREWQPQCTAKVFFYGRCQGVKGHKGVHWRFSGSGSFEWADNDDDPKHDGCAGSTPPGHDDYISPLEMQDHYHVSHYTDAKVTDKAVIAKLEKGKTPERDAAINRPVKFAHEGDNCCHLVISARNSRTVIWIVDRKGFPVQRAVGKLDTHLMPGRYAVDFGRAKPAYPLHLKRDSEYRQAELEKGPTCKRRIPKLDDLPDD